TRRARSQRQPRTRTRRGIATSDSGVQPANQALHRAFGVTFGTASSVTCFHPITERDYADKRPPFVPFPRGVGEPALMQRRADFRASSESLPTPPRSRSRDPKAANPCHSPPPT